MLTVIPILIFVALIIVWSGIKVVPQISMDCGTVWSLYQNADAGAESGRAVYGSHRPQN